MVEMEQFAVPMLVGLLVSLLSNPAWPAYAEIPPGPSKAGNGEVATHIARGIALAEKGDLDGAISEYRRALSVDPNPSGAHNGLGNILARKGDFDGAISEFHAALNLSPNVAVVHNALGSALWAKDDLDGAISEFRQAISRSPHLAIAHDNLERALLAKRGASGSGGRTEP